MRYAIYATPSPDHPLLTVMEAWLGRSAFRHSVVTQRGPFSAADHDTLVATRARYGFHATLKAPFELSSNFDHHTLLQTFTAFASRQQCVDVGLLQINDMGPFLALMPINQTQTLTDFAQATVEAFEPARAPLSANDFARRNKPDLSERQRELLQKWGYATTEEAFKYHMTLAGPSEPALLERARNHLQVALGAALSTPFVLDTIGLFQEPETPGPFHCIAHANLKPVVGN